MINVDKLTKELEAAGVAHGGCNSNGVVWGPDGTTEIQGQANVKAVLAAHDPTDTEEQERQALRARMRGKKPVDLTAADRAELVYAIAKQMGIIE